MSAVRTHLMQDLAAMRHELGNATAVVVTGDIAYSGAPEEYDVAREWLDLVSAEVGSPDSLVLTVPGNHDIHWPSIRPSAKIARETLRTCPMEQLTPMIDELIDDPDRPLLAPLDNYNEFALGYRCEVQEDGLPWEAPLPLSDGYHLAVRGLTTVFNSDRNDGRGTLVVGRTQTSLPIDDPGAVHLLLAHHGPEDCRDTTEIRDRIRHRAWALLCGHRHDQRVQNINGCLEITAGAVHPEEQPGYYPTYNWIRFDVASDGAGGHQLIVDVWQRVLRPEWNRFGASGEGPGPQREVFPLPTLSAVTAPVTTRLDGALVRAPRNEPQPTVTAAGSAEAAPRPPLTDEEGRVDEQRRIARDLLDLPVPDQERVLLLCGLLQPTDIDKDHVTMILTALGRADAPGALARLAAAVADARDRGRGRSA
ncbi:Calcineurin-like phosphoesterase superfamily domain-containing protein [Blastococcus tunisiensis]|uniref:Calcineurin-like phosphoesterase superfamily domain-containing protein n=2 Tax=Blastococcus tunisiensis TaxID=1798228 RepID=A0A1I1VYI1_9ACTN|nr:Calcineurin-like phosphoesterase superfamily domain-containing protein [Blastococcus sp. DSM 46838]